MRWWWILATVGLVACFGGQDGEDLTDKDSDTVIDSDTDVYDTDVPDTADTQDTDTVVDTDTVDTDVADTFQVDTDAWDTGSVDTDWIDSDSDGFDTDTFTDTDTDTDVEVGFAAIGGVPPVLGVVVPVLVAVPVDTDVGRGRVVAFLGDTGR